MKDQYELEQFVDVVNKENESKVKDQHDRISALEQQLNNLSQEASQDKGAADIIREWIDSGKVAIGQNGQPNIIQNAEDVPE